MKARAADVRASVAVHPPCAKAALDLVVRTCRDDNARARFPISRAAIMGEHV